EHVRECKYNNYPKEVTRATFAPLLKAVFDSRAKPLVVQNGFRACGLYPFSPDAVDYSKCLSSRTNVETPSIEASGQETGNTPTIDNPNQTVVDNQMSYLEYFESLIEQTTLTQFKKCGDTWTGDEKAHDLFHFWKTLYLRHDSQSTVPMTEGCNNAGRTVTPLIADSTPPHSSNMNMNIPITEENGSNYTPIQPVAASSSANNVQSRTSSLVKYKCDEVASPFKNYLLYPRTPDKDKNKQNVKKKLRFPAVVSSSEYREFLKKKDDAENMKNGSKRKRKAEKREVLQEENLEESEGQDKNAKGSSKGKQLKKRKRRKMTGIAKSVNLAGTRKFGQDLQQSGLSVRLVSVGFMLDVFQKNTVRTLVLIYYRNSMILNQKMK
ncbi:hypothetical protein J6590_106655, partial [Homalodisca vitripennis]